MAMIDDNDMIANDVIVENVEPDNEISYTSPKTPGTPASSREFSDVITNSGNSVSNSNCLFSVSDNTAPNLLINGHCKACDTENIDKSTHAIQCWFCKKYFHAINCMDSKLCVSANSAFSNTLLPAVTNTTAYERRFGRFLFSCDFCITLEETKRANASTDRVELLDKKIDSIHSDFKSELYELKKMLKDKIHVVSDSDDQSLASSSESRVCSGNKGNIWSDEHRIDNLKHMMVIKKSSDGQTVCTKKLETTCVDNSISVNKTFQLKKSNDTGIVLNSKKDAEALKVKLQKDLPNHAVEVVSARKPTINVVGLIRQYSKDDLLDMIKKQNSGLAALLSDSSASKDDTYMDLISVTPIRSYKGEQATPYKATLRVSNLVRSVIANQGDRLFVGSQNSCKVYDSFFILRCYKCQEFGHHSNDCENDSVCGFCAGSHETRQCQSKDNPLLVSCNNCKKAAHTDCKHQAGSLTCNVLLEKQKELKKRIPFYQGKIWENGQWTLKNI